MLLYSLSKDVSHAKIQKEKGVTNTTEKPKEKVHPESFWNDTIITPTPSPAREC